MAEKTLAILLTARDQASGPIRRVSREVGTLGSVSARARAGVGALAGNLKLLGAAALVGLGATIKSGLDSLEQLESATSAADAAIRQMGLTGQVTAQQIHEWAVQIDTAVGHAFDDKPITRATATLIRYGKLTAQNIRPAMVVMTDLAAKTGDVDSAAALLAKALAAPEKAAGKLVRAGVTLTQQQQDELKALVKAGKAAQAQSLLLEQLARTTQGAALASQGPYARALALLSDAAEDARMALAEGLLPVIERGANLLRQRLADPATLAQIRELGRSIANLFSRGLETAERFPWGAMADAMRLAGQAGKALFDLFTGMPPWVQTAVLTGWGLNKLTGGALSGIVGELAKGLIKGVLGVNAAVVNINAGVVNTAGPGGLLGAVGGAAGAGTLLGTVLRAAGIALPVLALVATGATLGFAALQASDILAPQHQFAATNRFGGHTFRATNTGAPPAHRFGGPAIRAAQAVPLPPPLPGFNAKFVSPELKAELAAIDKFAASAGPSLRSMEAHLARLREIEQRAPAEARATADLIVAAINRLQAVIAANRPIVTVTARSVDRATVSWRRMASVGGVRID